MATDLQQAERSESLDAAVDSLGAGGIHAQRLLRVLQCIPGVSLPAAPQQRGRAVRVQQSRAWRVVYGVAVQPHGPGKVLLKVGVVACALACLCLLGQLRPRPANITFVSTPVVL